MGVRWYEIQGIPTSPNPERFAIRNFFESSPSNTTTNRYYWMGTVMVSGQGHMAMGCRRLQRERAREPATAGRLVNDPAGTCAHRFSTPTASPPTTRAPGRSIVNRWGDYSMTSVDPADDMTMWTVQEFVAGENSYGVQVAKLLAPPPATPASCSPPHSRKALPTPA